MVVRAPVVWSVKRAIKTIVEMQTLRFQPDLSEFRKWRHCDLCMLKAMHDRL